MSVLSGIGGLATLARPQSVALDLRTNYDAVGASVTHPAE